MKLETRLGNRWICNPRWNLYGPALRENAFNAETTRYPNFYFFNSTYFVFFRQGVNLNSFIPEANCSFLSISRYDFWFGIWILIGQKWQKWFCFRHVSKFQLVLLENYSCEFLYRVLNWRFHTTTGFLHWSFIFTLWFYSLHWLILPSRSPSTIFSVNIASLLWNQMLCVQYSISVSTWQKKLQFD